MADRPVSVRRSSRDAQAWEVLDTSALPAPADASAEALVVPPRIQAVVDAAGRTWVAIDGLVVVAEMPVATSRPRAGAAGRDALSAPMPATVIAVQVAVGDTVEAGDTLVLLEAMKMEVPLRAPHAGVVTVLRCAPGDLVQPGGALVDIEDLP